MTYSNIQVYFQRNLNESSVIRSEEDLLKLHNQPTNNFKFTPLRSYTSIYENEITDSNIASFKEACSNEANKIFNPKSSITFTNTFSFLNEVPFNYLGTYLDKPVLSILSPEIYQKMNYIHLLNDCNFYDSVTQVRKIVTKHTSRNNYNASFYQYNIPSCHNEANVSLQDLIITFVPNNETPLEINFQSNINVITTKATCTGSDFNLTIESISPKKYSKPNGNFLPIYIPAKVYYPVEDKVIDCYIFTFMFNLPVSKTLKYKKARKYLFSFVKDIYSYFGSKFYNSNLSNYIKAKQLTSFQDLTYYQYTLAQKGNNINKLKEIVNQKFIDSPSNFFKQFELPLTFKKKKEKIVNKYESNIKFLNSFESQIDLDSKLNNYISYKKSYQYFQERLKEAQKNFEDVKLNLQKSKDELKAIFDNFEYNLKINNPIKNSYDHILLQQNELFKTLSGKQNLTYENLFKDIDLISFSYSKKGEESEQNFIKVDLSTQENFIGLTLDQLFFTENTIQEVCFATKHPVKISLVSDKNTSVVGGPYIIKCTPSNLKIRLKDYKSFYGMSSRTHSFSYYVHPHASSTSILSLEYRSACLGEASSLLYSAFKKNDINLIIVSAMLWVRSANSSDAWGKHYINFQPYEEYLEEASLEDFELNQDLEDFILKNNLLFDPLISHHEIDFTNLSETIEEDLPSTVESNQEEKQEQPINSVNDRYKRYLSLMST